MQNARILPLGQKIVESENIDEGRHMALIKTQIADKEFICVS